MQATKNNSKGEKGEPPFHDMNFHIERYIKNSVLLGYLVEYKLQNSNTLIQSKDNKRFAAYSIDYTDRCSQCGIEFIRGITTSGIKFYCMRFI